MACLTPLSGYLSDISTLTCPLISSWFLLQAIVPIVPILKRWCYAFSWSNETSGNPPQIFSSNYNHIQSIGKSSPILSVFKRYRKSKHFSTPLPWPPRPNHHVSHMDYCNSLEQLSLLPLPTRKTEGLINVMSFSCSKFSSRCSFHVSARMICGISGPIGRSCFPSPRPPITWASLLLRAFARTVLSAWDALPPDNWKTQFFILVGTLLKCHICIPRSALRTYP